jgi:hypothetical protein
MYTVVERVLLLPSSEVEGLENVVRRRPDAKLRSMVCHRETRACGSRSEVITKTAVLTVTPI